MPNASPCRIGICLSLFPPVTGGAELLLLRLAERWVAAGHAVTVFTRRHPEAPAVETMNGVLIRRCIRTLEIGPLFGASFVATLTAALLRHADSYDVLVAFQAPWESAATGWVAPRRGKPSVVVIQQSGPFGDLAKLRDSKGAGWLRKAFLRHDEFVGLSEHARSELIAFGCPPARTRVITNGIEVARFAATEPAESDPERDRTVLFVGRLTEQKNPKLLLEAWREVNPSGDYRLLIVGDGPLRGELDYMCNRAGLEHVEFLGRQSDMPAVYRKAAVFVLPSVGEGCCMALLEAMAGGLCPVVTDIGGNRDVVTHDETGVLVPSGDRDALTAALREVLSQAGRRQRLGSAAAAHIALYHDIDRTAERYLELFRRLTNPS